VTLWAAQTLGPAGRLSLSIRLISNRSVNSPKKSRRPLLLGTPDIPAWLLRRSLRQFKTLDAIVVGAENAADIDAFDKKFGVCGRGYGTNRDESGFVQWLIFPPSRSLCEFQPNRIEGAWDVPCRHLRQNHFAAKRPSELYEPGRRMLLVTGPNGMRGYARPRRS